MSLSFPSAARAMRPLYMRAPQRIHATSSFHPKMSTSQLQHNVRGLTTTSPTAATPAPPKPSTLPPFNPLNIPAWVAENKHLLQPPINNYCITNTPQTIMVVGGPNARTDYHINSTPEFFFQVRGAMLLKTIQSGAFVDVPIPEGSIYLLPANIPHNPVRFADTVGLVIEQPRPEGALDALRWYCQGCGTKVEEKSFVCTDLGSQIKSAVQAFEADSQARTCKSCGTFVDVRPPDVEALRPRV